MYICSDMYMYVCVCVCVWVICVSKLCLYGWVGGAYYVHLIVSPGMNMILSNISVSVS